MSYLRPVGEWDSHEKSVPGGGNSNPNPEGLGVREGTWYVQGTGGRQCGQRGDWEVRDTDWRGGQGPVSHRSILIYIKLNPTDGF